jgi:hypothetical protein
MECFAQKYKGNYVTLTKSEWNIVLAELKFASMKAGQLGHKEWENRYSNIQATILGQLEK